jgi:hypothetical protein
MSHTPLIPDPKAIATEELERMLRQRQPRPGGGITRQLPAFGSAGWLHDLHVNSAERALALLKKKNADYAGDGDVFKNLNACEALGVKAEMGMLIRMQDKISRLSNVIGSGKNHVGDSIESEVFDIINYAVLLLARVQVRERIVRDSQPAQADPRGA